jgi:serine/threonine protein kinase
MPVTVHCPNPRCRQVSRMTEEELGQAARCKLCGEKFTLAAVTTVGDSPEATLDDQVIASPGGAPPGSNPKLPRQIGRFQIRERLGAGAFGTVYRAFDPQLEREVALKVPHPSTLEKPGILKRFLHEARSAAQLRHPHIVPVHELGQANGQHYIVAAFIKGQTLAARIEDGPLAARQAAQMVQQLAEALAYAHQLGIVHRDIKPANIMLDEHQQPLIMDFGLAHWTEASQRLTNTGALLGTPAYMAPEQAAGQARRPLPASDQYSLGVVLYESLTGQLPFTAAHLAGLIYQIISTEPPPPRKLKADVPPVLERICLKAMAKQHEQRYADCQALAADLQSCLVDSLNQPAPTPLKLPPTKPAIVNKPAPSVSEFPNSIGMKLALIPAGRFTMGHP